jgi:guanylate cyclase
LCLIPLFCYCSGGDTGLNLMDHVLGLVEGYAGGLEREVDERSRELVGERARSDQLLNRMLPPQVVARLKAGEPIEPEQFAAATVLFSDIVRFTVLASRCSPLQAKAYSKIDLYNHLQILH